MAKWRRYERFGTHRMRYLTAQEVAEFKARIAAIYTDRTAMRTVLDTRPTDTCHITRKEPKCTILV